MFVLNQILWKMLNFGNRLVINGKRLHSKKKKKDYM